MEKLQTASDVFFLLMGAILVFAMHGGFAFLEVGTVRHKNQVNALCKIIVDFAISVVCYFLVGYAIAYGVSFTFNADQFAMFKVGKGQEDGQMKLASAIMDKNFQEQFNLVKGSIPARMDISDKNFEACGKKSMADLKVAVQKNTLLGSFAHGHAVPESIKGAMIDVVTKAFNSGTTPADATKQLVAAVKASKQ